MKKRAKKREMIFGVFIVGIFLISFVSAFSVSMPYMEDKKMHILPGEIRDLEFVLQNGGATDNVNAGVRIIEGSQIIKVTGTEDSYLVIPGKQTPVNLRVEIPGDAQIGDSYHVKLAFSTIESNTGSFAFGSEIEQNFDVIIGEKAVRVIEPEEEEVSLKGFLSYGILIIVLIVVLIVFFVIRKRKK